MQAAAAVAQYRSATPRDTVQQGEAASEVNTSSEAFALLKKAAEQGDVADSGASRTVIPAHCGQHSGDCGQFLMSV